MNIITVTVNQHNVKMSTYEELTPEYVLELCDFVRKLEAEVVYAPKRKQ